MNPIMRRRAEGLNVVEVDRGFWSEVYVSGFITETDKLTSHQVSVLRDLLDDEAAAHIRLFGGVPNLPEELIGEFYNGSCPDACDMIIGPCACGATHHLRDWFKKLGWQNEY